MMKKILSVLFLAAFAVTSLFVFASNEETPSTDAQLPENVKAIVDKSCFGCHNTGSRNEDAKEALDFKKLDGLSKIKKIGAYKDIEEVVESGDMPPKRFLERYPDRKISDEEKTVLMEWAKKEAVTLVKGE